MKIRMIEYLRANDILMKGKYLKHNDGALRTTEEWETFIQGLNIQ